MSAIPRSGRTKKKSALSRLAQLSNETAQASDESEQELSYSNSRDELAGTLNRQHIDSGYTRNRGFQRRNDSDSDEGIEMRGGTGSSGMNGTGHRLPAIPSHSGLHGQIQSESDDDSDDPPLLHGEKRYRDQNSDGDDLRNRQRKEQSSEQHKWSEPGRDGERPYSRLGYDDDEELDPSFGKQRSINHGKTLELNRTLTMKQPKEDIMDMYRDALDRQDQSQDSDDDDLTGESEKDDLAELRRFSHSPPRPSARSPEHHRHDIHRQITTSSMASSITSRTFKKAGNKPDPFGNLSQASLHSTSVLPMISTKEAKNRSFMVGSITGNGSLLGGEELERYFPDRKMRIFCGTWNMCEMKTIPGSLDEFILPDTSEYVQDMYIIATQESTPNRREWELKLQETLGPQHVLLHTVVHGVLLLCVFIRRDLIWYTSVCEEGLVTTRPGPSGIKTKGAAALAFSVFGTSFLFLSTHFSAHDGKIKERIADYHKICSGLQLPKGKAHEGNDVTARYDCVFWLGDLNFRIEKERDRVNIKVKGIESSAIPDFEELMVHDELFRARNEGLAFVEFQEGRIKFKPTYKYDAGTDTFDTSKKMRIPSYTDRVLFRCRKKNGITCLHYDSAHEVRESDHRPVYGMFEVDLRPGRDKYVIPLSAGQFNKDIWLEANRRRGLTYDTIGKMKKNQKNSSVCTIQ